MLLLISMTWGQQRPGKKPVLIREDVTEQVEAEPEEIVPDPIQAKKHLEVGDFYFKKKNFKAAAERYRDAVLFAPRSSQPYAKLAQALEKMKEFLEAAEVCREFMEKNPDSEKADDFAKRAEKLNKKVTG